MSDFLVAVAKAIEIDFGGAYALGRISQPIKVKRRSAPDFKAGTLPHGEWQVLISGVGNASTRISRGMVGLTASVEIGVVCRLAGRDVEYTDPGHALLQELALYHFHYDLHGGIACWEANDPYFWGDPDLLESDGVFFGLWSATFRGSLSKQGGP